MSARIFVDIHAPTRKETFDALAAFAAPFYGKPLKIATRWRGRDIEAKATGDDIEIAYRATLAKLGTTPEEDEAPRTLETD